MVERYGTSCGIRSFGNQSAACVPVRSTPRTDRPFVVDLVLSVPVPRSGGVPSTPHLLHHSHTHVRAVLTS